MTQQKQKTKKQISKSQAATNASIRTLISEPDSTYFLKLVLIVILGTLWLKFSQPLVLGDIPLNGVPVGLIVGLMGIRLLEKNAVDRKIWYAVLIIIGVISYFVPAGIVI